MRPQELKASVLWNAIQGKLTNQSENESAEELIEGISLSQLAEEECYFDIPNNWKWCKIKDVFTLVNGKAFKPTDWGQYGLPIVRIQNLNDPNSPFNYFAGEIEEKYLLNGGELLFSWSGTPGTSFGAFIWNGRKAVLNQHIFIVYPEFQIDTKYAMYALNGELKIFIDKAHGGAGLKHITKKEFENCGLPIPPLAEQKRIVAKIEELLPLIDRYEQAWSKLEDFNKRFPVDMQKSILQMAIQGKLVEQRPEEGTGEELYQQIQVEKQRLIKSGELRKTKALPIITAEDIPTDFPESWKVCYMDDIAFVTKLAGFEYTKNVAPNLVSNGIPLFKGKNVQNGKLVLKFESYIPETVSDELPRSQILKKCLLTPYVGTIGNIAIFDGSFKAHLGSNVGKIELLNGLQEYVMEEYVLYYLRSTIGYDELTKYKKATAQESISIDAIRNVIIALPPLAEQKRIVAKLEEILPLCDRLK